MNKSTPTAIQISTREAQHKGWGVAVIIMVLFGFIALTVQPPLSRPSLTVYTLLSLALAVLYAWGTPRYVRYPEKYGMISVLPVAVLGAGLLLGIALTLWGRVQLYFLLFVLIGYALLVYYSKKRYWPLLFLAGMIVFSWLCYGFVGGWETAIAELLGDLPWLALMITLAEAGVHRLEQQDRTAAIAAELAEAHQQIKEYAAQVEELAITRERARLAHEIHDTVGHTLTALDVQLELLVRLPPGQSELRQQIAEKSRALVKGGLADVRRAVQALQPVALETFSLHEAIAGLVADFDERMQISAVYQVMLLYPENTTQVLYDQVPTYTTYLSGSLIAPVGLVYDAATNAISGTLSLSADISTSVSFAVRVDVEGTADFAPPIVNRACVYLVGEDMSDCTWSNEVRHAIGL